MSATGGIEAALEEAIGDTPRLPRDAAAVQLALRYAELMDDLLESVVTGDAAEDGAAHARVILEISRVGARLEAVLDKLGMTPASRPALMAGGGGDGDTEARELDALRRDAAAGAPNSGLDYAAAVDPAVTGADAAD